MSNSKIDIIKSIRYKTGLSLKDISKAVSTLNTDVEEEIIKCLREQGILKQEAKQGRQTKNGGIFSYTHENRIGVLLEVKCETDFVARSKDFRNFANDILLHIAANQPKFLSEKDINKEFIESELKIFEKQLLEEGKPQDKIAMILKGKRIKIAQENTLLDQPFLKDSSILVRNYLSQIAQKTSENIVISKFVILNLNS